MLQRANSKDPQQMAIMTQRLSCSEPMHFGDIYATFLDEKHIARMKNFPAVDRIRHESPCASSWLLLKRSDMPQSVQPGRFCTVLTCSASAGTMLVPSVMIFADAQLIRFVMISNLPLAWATAPEMPQMQAGRFLHDHISVGAVMGIKRSTRYAFYRAPRQIAGSLFLAKDSHDLVDCLRACQTCSPSWTSLAPDNRTSCSKNLKFDRDGCQCCIINRS